MAYEVDLDADDEGFDPGIPSTEPRRCIDLLIARFNGLSATARVMGVQRQNVYYWRKSGRIPSHYAFDVEDLTEGEIAAERIINENRESKHRERSA